MNIDFGFKRRLRLTHRESTAFRLLVAAGIGAVGYFFSKNLARRKSLPALVRATALSASAFGALSDDESSSFRSRTR